MSKSEAAWIRVQEQAFTSWMNDTVKQRGFEVTDLRTDLEDGIKLINFFEILAGRDVAMKYDRKPVQRIQKISNLHIALSFLEKTMMVRNPGCSAEDIIDAETRGIKLILGLLWTLYRLYRMRVDLGDGKKKGREEDMLLEWVKKTLDDNGYDSSEVTSFRTSFNDGKVFLKLGRIYDGGRGTIPFDEIEASGNAQETLEEAFNYAENEMGISKLLGAEEVAEGVMDERALALYTSLFYHAFKTREELSKMEQAVGDSATQLQLQKKGKEELIKMNCELADELERTKAELEETKAALAMANEELEELRARLDEQDAALAKLREEKGDVEGERNAESAKRASAEQEAARLRNEVEACNALYDSETMKCKGLAKENENLQEELRKAKELSDFYKAGYVDADLDEDGTGPRKGHKTLIEKLDEEQARNKELTAKFEAQVKKGEDDEAEIGGLRRKLKKHKEDLDTTAERLAEAEDAARTNTSGLAVLRANLDTHFSDLHRWQKFLDTASAAEMDEEANATAEKMLAEMEGMSFQDQLNHISTYLERENAEMEKILQEREAQRSPAKKKKSAMPAATEEKKKESKKKGDKK